MRSRPHCVTAIGIEHFRSHSKAEVAYSTIQTHMRRVKIEC